jgi:hypothetical protein
MVNIFVCNGQQLHCILAYQQQKLNIAPVHMYPAVVYFQECREYVQTCTTWHGTYSVHKSYL